MKIEYRHIAFRTKTRALIETCDGIIETYQAQGLRLSLRQLYYQLVSQNILPNTDLSYKRLSETISHARIAGLIDWDAIEDRIRVPRIPWYWGGSPREYLQASIEEYRVDRHAGQEVYVELWVEKDALAGVLAPIADDHDVTLLVNRGYSSQTAMWESAERFLDRADRECVLLYLGDHDPSGDDMVRDIRDRLNDLYGAQVDVQKIAITPEQVAQYNPPPNRAKVSDSRAARFIAQYGSESYEVDALPPAILNQIVTDAIEGYVDYTMRQGRLDLEEEHRTAMRDAADAL